MGTVVSIDIRQVEDRPKAERAVAEVVHWLHRVDEVFSTFRADSYLTDLRAGRLALEDCPPEMEEVLSLADACATRTQGAFDPYYDPAGVDPTGLVKGWAAERASNLLIDAGCVHHCINAAGDVRVMGQPRPHERWRIGIADVFRSAQVVAVVDGTDLAVATSGTAYRPHHVFDPTTGRPATAIASATVTGPDLALADAYATAAVASGPRARALLDSLDRDGWASLVVYASGQIWWSDNFRCAPRALEAQN